MQRRFRACRQLGIQPITKDWDGVGTPEAFVLDQNLHRRHLIASQRAIVMAEFATLKHGEIGRGRQVQKLDGGIPPSIMTNQQAADHAKVSVDTIKDAKIVLTRGTEEEIAAVRLARSASVDRATLTETDAQQRWQPSTRRDHRAARGSPASSFR
jgi:hypothetical protein